MAENAKLKEENAKLKKQLSDKPKAKKRRRIFRNTAIILLVSIATALLTSANLLFWFGNTVVKQDRFVAATEPIIKDPKVQSTMALYVTNNIFNNVDVQKATEEALPPRADFLAPQLTNQLKSFTQTSLQKVLARPQFQERWNTASARQHERLINFATKYEGNGDISLNDVFNNLRASLGDTKLAFLADKQLPPKVGDITVVNATWLPAFHDLVVNIDTWRLIAVILLLLTVSGAVWLSRNRRRTLYIFASATVVMMLLTLAALQIIKSNILGKVDPQYKGGVEQVIPIVFHSLVLQTITILAAAIFIGAVAWVSSSSKYVLSLKRQINSIFSGQLHSRIFKQENGMTLWVGKHKQPLEWTVLGLLAAIMLLVRLTLKSLIIYAILLVLIILAIEVLGGQKSKPGRPARSKTA